MEGVRIGVPSSPKSSPKRLKSGSPRSPKSGSPRSPQRNEKFLEVEAVGVSLSDFAAHCKREFKGSSKVGMLKACRKGASTLKKYRKCKYPSWSEDNALLSKNQWKTVFAVGKRLAEVLSSSTYNGEGIWFEQAVVIDLTATAVINALLKMGFLCKPDSKSDKPSLPSIYSWNIITMTLRFMQKIMGDGPMAPFKLTRFPQRGANSKGSKSHFVPDEVLRHFGGYQKIVGDLDRNRHGAEMLFSAVRHHLASNSKHTLKQAAYLAFPEDSRKQKALLKFWEAFMRQMWVESCTTFSKLAEDKKSTKRQFGIFSNYLIANVACELLGRPLFFESSTIMVKDKDGNVECKPSVNADKPHVRRFQPFFEKIGAKSYIVVKCGIHAPCQKQYEAKRRKVKVGMSRKMPKHSKLKWIDLDTMSETINAEGKIESEYVIGEGAIRNLAEKALKKFGLNSSEINKLFDQAGRFILGRGHVSMDSLGGMFGVGPTPWNWNTVLNEKVIKAVEDFDMTKLELPDDLIDKFKRVGRRRRDEIHGPSKRKKASRKIVRERHPRKPRRRSSPAHAKAQARARNRVQARNDATRLLVQMDKQLDEQQMSYDEYLRRRTEAPRTREQEAMAAEFRREQADEAERRKKEELARAKDTLPIAAAAPKSPKRSSPKRPSPKRSSPKRSSPKRSSPKPPKRSSPKPPKRSSPKLSLPTEQANVLDRQLADLLDDEADLLLESPQLDGQSPGLYDFTNLHEKHGLE